MRRKNAQKGEKRSGHKKAFELRERENSISYFV